MRTSKVRQIKNVSSVTPSSMFFAKVTTMDGKIKGILCYGNQYFYFRNIFIELVYIQTTTKNFIVFLKIPIVLFCSILIFKENSKCYFQIRIVQF